jgi:ADP-ribosylglycohydrolase
MIMTTQATAMVLASFAADSLALGAHWIYDTDAIDQRIGRVDRLLKPLPDSYHSGKAQGEFTHYGDQALVLLESLARTGAFSLTDFAASWQTLFNGYRGYIDKATATTLENIAGRLPPDQCGSHSSDLGGAARIAPLVSWYRSDRDRLLEAVRQQTAMTHNNPATLAGAAFIAKTAWEVLRGTDPVTAMENALEEGVADIDLDNRIRGGLDSGGKDTRTVIKKFGQMCGIAAALPGAIHLIITYPNDLKTALIENVMAGGDSAARGLVAGMILGAHLGEAAIPKEWLTGMVRSGLIINLLAAGKGEA